LLGYKLINEKDNLKVGTMIQLLKRQDEDENEDVMGEGKIR
jgi:hypothetical protein